MTCRISFISFALLALSLCVAGDVLVIPAMRAPNMDGVLDANEWKGTAKGSLVELRTGNAPENPTEWQMGCDAENLYLGVKCSEKDIKGIRKRFTHIEERDNSIYMDDCIEFLVDVFGKKAEGKFHFIVNSMGIIYDAYNGDTAYESGIKVACKINANFWAVEMALPFADLGIVPKGAELFSINICRERQVGSRPELSCLAKGTAGFDDRERFQFFRPAPLGDKLPPVTFKSFGSPARKSIIFSNTGKADENTYTVMLDAFDAKGNKIGEYEGTTRKGEETCLDYGKSGKNIHGLNFKVSKDKKTLYYNTFIFPGLASEKKCIAMAVKNPLFKELLSNEYPPRRNYHGFQWMFGMGMQGYMNLFALQNALAHSSHSIAVEQKNTGMAAYANVTMIDWLDKEVFCKELGTPKAIMPRPLGEKVKSGLAYDLVIIPEIRKLWLDDVRTIASRKDVEMITWWDEVSETVEMHLIDEFKRLPDNPELKAFDAMIKEKYGQGKYGILTSADESDPLAWIAFRRAINDELVSLFRESYKLAKSLNPNIVVVSDDPVGHQNKIYSFSDRQGTCDIVTHQLYPRGNPNIDNFGFLTRYLAHLTGAKEVWPCAHVEEYGASFTPREVLLKLSSAVRNGATGFHYYLNDTVGLRNGKKYMIHEFWGAPDRYAVEIGVQKLLAKMPRLAFPEYDAALFTAADSLRAIPGVVNRQSPSRDLYLHGYLGYGAGVNYRFINEFTLQNLDRFKLIVSAENKYISIEAFKALEEYVRRGGTILLVNQDAFCFTPEGKDLTEQRRKFTGVDVSWASQSPVSFNYSGKKIPVSSIRCAKLRPLGNAKVLSRFQNGDPAIVSNPFGKGRVVTLAGNPCVAKLAGNGEWGKFFLDFCRECKTNTNCDIWRFQLPESLLPKQVRMPGKCITNNFVLWEHFIPTTPNNSGLNGSYTLSPAPSRSKDKSEGEIPFSEGKLTDRPKAVMAPSVCQKKGNLGDWVVSWNQVNAPISIKCTWSEPRPIRKVKLFVSDIWRDASLEIGGQVLNFACPKDFNKYPLSVREVVMELPSPVVSDKLSITIGADSNVLTIAEMEIWSD